MLARLLLAAIVLVTTVGTIAQAQAPDAAKSPGPTVLTATGSARVERAPDYVDVMIGKSVQEKTASEAQSAATKAIESAVAAIRALKLEGVELQTGSVDLSPHFERNNGEQVPQIIGYDASMTVRVRTTDLKSVARIIDAALSAGCNRVDYVQFGIKEALSAREEAITLATKAARRKAEVLASACDLRLTRVVDASTTSQQGGWYPYGRGQMAQMANSMQGPQGGTGEEQGPILPGKVEVWADTTLKFEAAPK